jgi:hypothetical protein
MFKYGMKYDTIRYWQAIAREHVKYHGRREAFQQSMMYYLHSDRIADVGPRVIAHCAIQCAEVLHPSAVRCALK